VDWIYRAVFVLAAAQERGLLLENGRAELLGAVLNK
jgi:hypothetical protein